MKKPRPKKPNAADRITAAYGSVRPATSKTNELAGHVGAYRGEPEAQPVRARDVAHHGERLFEMRRRTRRAGSADQEMSSWRAARRSRVGSGRGRRRGSLPTDGQCAFAHLETLQSRQKTHPE